MEAKPEKSGESTQKQFFWFMFYFQYEAIRYNLDETAKDFQIPGGVVSFAEEHRERKGFMSNTRILIVDDHEELRRCMGEYFRQQPGITVAGEAGNGVDALKLAEEGIADVMLLDLIMPGLDGFGVMERLQHLPAEKRPRVVVVTALSREDFIRRAVELGAMYYMIKPVELPVLLERVTDVSHRAADAVSPSRAVAAAGLTLDDRLSNLFLGMGIPAHIKGYQYLREAIRLVIEKPDMIGGITKELYPAVARRFNTSSSKVERAIRHAIEVAWSRGRVDTLNKAFGCRVAHPEEKPTNGEFIALIADKLSVDRPA